MKNDNCRIIIKEDGTKVYLNEDGKTYRADGPAIIKPNGGKSWYDGSFNFSRDISSNGTVLIVTDRAKMFFTCNTPNGLKRFFDGELISHWPNFN